MKNTIRTALKKITNISTN